MRLLVLVLAGVCFSTIAGCVSFGPATIPRDRFDYVSTIADSWKAQMLLNIVKLRYADTPAFLDLGSVISQYEFAEELNAGLGWGLPEPGKVQQHGWIRSVLATRIDALLHGRAGEPISNFAERLPAAGSDLVQQSFKDPCLLDFIATDAPLRERGLEDALITHLERFACIVSAPSISMVPAARSSSRPDSESVNSQQVSRRLWRWTPQGSAVPAS